MAARQVVQSIQTPPVDADELLDWAQFRYASLFPRGAASYPLEFEGRRYTVRSYEGAWGTRYLSVTSDGEVLGLGDFTAGALQSFGRIADYAPLVLADRCGVYPERCVVQRLAIGAGHAVALRADGTALTWGLDNVGQLGSGTTLPGSTARVVPTAATAVAVSAFESIALGIDGTVTGWGERSTGTILGGDVPPGPPQRVGSPIPTAFPDDVRSVAVGITQVAFAVRGDGTVWHTPGLASPVTTGLRISARQVPGLEAIVSVASSGGGAGRVVAVDVSGGVWEVQLRAALPAGSWEAAAVRIPGLPAVASATCGPNDCLAVARDRNLWRWTSGQAPARVEGIDDVVAVTVSPFAWYAITSDGRLRGQGALTGGVTGIEDDNNLTLPTAIPGVDDAVEVAAGLASVVFRRRDGTVWGFGNNALGELGVVGRQPVPVQIAGVDLR